MKKPPHSLEFLTIEKMVDLYCKAHHQNPRCPKCQEFLDYAFTKLKSCPFGNQKPACKNCSIHCYQKDRREEAKAIMRFAGPRMVFHHPLLAIFHLLHKMKKLKGLKFRS